MSDMWKTLKISKDDIYGAIKGFPLEVVQKMVELTIKEKHTDIEGALKILRNTSWSGFTWSETDEGNLFWYKVIHQHEWWRFYERYQLIYLLQLDMLWLKNLAMVASLRESLGI